MSITTISILGSVFALAAAILSFIFIVPAKKKLNPFFQFLHNLFNFKDLMLEKIFKFLYVLSTLFCISSGFFMLFYVEESYHYGGWYSSGYYTTEWKGYYGLLLMIVGPIAVRIAYEFIMMIILAVKNIMEINQSVQKIVPQEEEAPEAPVADPYAINYAEFPYQQPGDFSGDKFNV